MMSEEKIKRLRELGILSDEFADDAIIDYKQRKKEAEEDIQKMIEIAKTLSKPLIVS